MKVRSVGLTFGLRGSRSGGHRHIELSVRTMVKPVVLTEPPPKAASDVASHSSELKEAYGIRALVILPSGPISALNEKPRPHSLSLFIDEPLNPTDAAMVRAVCELTLADASQWDESC